MKKLILTTILGLQIFAGYSQSSNINEVRKELDESLKKSDSLIQINSTIRNANERLRDSVENLLSENNYFRDALHILTPIASADIEHVKVALLSCVGKKQDQSITMTFSLQSTDINKTVQFEMGNLKGTQLAVDLQGNTYNSDKVEGSSSKYASEVFVDAPVKATVKFEGIPSSVQLLKTIKLFLFSPAGGLSYKKIHPQFTDIKVSWD